MPRADPPPLRVGPRIGQLLERAFPKLALCAGLALAFTWLGAAISFSHGHALLINASPSLPHWAIWLDRSGTPRRGDLILFNPPRSELLTQHFGPRPQPFGKRVFGVPGDHVTEKNREFFVNGRKVAFAKTETLRGEPLALGPTGIVPKGCYFVGSPHKDGFDSRYAAIGWICTKQVLGVGRPIL